MNHTSRIPVLVSALLVLGLLTSPARSQVVGVTFDEDGTVDGGQYYVPLVVGSAFEVFVVAYDLVEIAGYEFQMTPLDPPSLFLGKTLYGPAPQDSATEYEVRVTMGGCVNDPTAMGPSAASWTLCRYDLLYLTSSNDVYFCLNGSAESGAGVPRFALCDEGPTMMPMYPGNVSLCGSYPDGCAVANNTLCIIIPAESPSWGTLKSQYGTVGNH